MSQANLRTVAVLLSLLWCARPDRSYADQAQDEHTLKSIAFSPLNELHIIGADVDADKHLRWAVWSEASEQGSSVRLALVANTVHGPKIVSSLIRDGAFEPTLIRVQNWRHGKHPVIALAYLQGAAAVSRRSRWRSTGSTTTTASSSSRAFWGNRSNGALATRGKAS